MDLETAKKILANRAKRKPEEVKDAAAFLLGYRKSHDPIQQFVPSPTQREFMESRVRHRLLTGPNRGGKSAAAAVLLARSALRKDPVWSTKMSGLYVIMAPSRDQIRDPWFKKLFEKSELKGSAKEDPMIPMSEVAVRNGRPCIYYTYGAGQPTPKMVELKNGNRIWFLASGKTSAWKDLEGKGMILGIVLDESAGDAALIEEACVRLLDANSDEQVKKDCGGGWLIWGATETKVNPGYTEFRQRCEDPNNEDFAAFVLSPDENPAVDSKEREKYSKILGEDAFQSRMRGVGGALSALLVYPQFEPERHLVTPDYEPQDGDTLYVGYDPGSHVTGIVFAAFNEKTPDVMRVFRCAETRRASIESDVQLMLRATRGRPIERLVYDQAARKLEKVGKSVASMLAEEMKKQGLISHRGLGYGRSEYESSVPLVRNLFEKDKILINASPITGCGILKQELQTFRFTDQAGLLKESNMSKGNDHCLDALRYLASTRPTYVKRKPSRPTLSLAQTKDLSEISEQDRIEMEKMRRSKLIASQVMYPELHGWRVVS